MNKRIAITGRPGCGKTTLCKRVAERFGTKVAGLITEEIREGDKRVGFRLKNLTTEQTGLLSHVKECSGPSVGKYSVCLDQLNSIGAKAIKQGLRGGKLLIIDEIGPMELQSDKFVELVEWTLQEDVDCLFTIHRRSTHPLLKTIRDEFEVKRLTKRNRDRVLEKVIKTFKTRLR